MQYSFVIALIIFMHTTILQPSRSLPPHLTPPKALFKLVSTPSFDYSRSNAGTAPILSSTSSLVEEQAEESVQHRHQLQPESFIGDDYGYWKPVPHYDGGDPGPIPHAKVPN